MPLANPSGLFGIHSVCFYNRNTGVPLAFLRVLNKAELKFNAEWSDLKGGSQMYLWDSEISGINGEITLEGREYEPDTMALLLGGTLDEETAEASGAIAGLANVKGDSVYDVTTGIDGVTISTAANAKTGKYIIEATAAAKFKVYCLSDIDFHEGEDTVYGDDSLVITETDLDISSADAVLADYGLTFGKGSGTIAMTIGDTAEFYVRKVNAGSFVLDVGSASSSFEEYGVMIMAQKKSGGTIDCMEIYKAKVAGMPLSFGEKNWSDWSVTIKALYDSDKDKVFSYRRIIGA